MKAADTWEDPVEDLARDHKKMLAALDFLAEAHQAGRTGTEGLQTHGIAGSWDPHIIHLATAIEAEGQCLRCLAGDKCGVGEDLWGDVEAAKDAYLKATGADFDTPAEGEWRAWQRRQARYQAHLGLTRPIPAPEAVH